MINLLPHYVIMVDVIQKMMNSVLSTYNNSKNNETSSVLTKQASNESPMGYTPRQGIVITPGAIIGTAVGAYLGNRNAKKQADIQMQRELAHAKKVRPVVEGDYYKQTNHIINNLSTVFTPFGVVYTLKNKNNNVAIETIETIEMNPEMKEAWKNKDKYYFKNLMLSKMFSDIQLAEQSFAKKLIDGYRKNANEMIEDMFFLMDKQANYNDLTEEDVEREIAANDCYEIDFKLQRPFTKYAGLINGISSSLGFGEINKSSSKFKKDLESPKYLSNNVKVAFLPDRVLFIVDETLVSTLSVLNMNEQEFKAFNENSQDYFKKVFKNKVSEEKTADVEFEEKIYLEKVANINTEAEMFLKAGIHPVIYFLELNKKYGLEWLDFDPKALTIMISKDYELPVEINDSALDKILSIQAANKTSLTYKNPHVFEKVIRAFNDKPINFMQVENKDLDIDDFAFGIDVLDRVTPYDDVYDNFSEEVFGYISEALTKVNAKVYLPSLIVGSPLEAQFTEALNEMLLKVCDRETTKETDNLDIIDYIKEKNSKIHYVSITCIKAIRHAMQNLGDNPNIHVLTDDACVKMRVEEDIIFMVKEQILKNLALDQVLALKERALRQQLVDYNITEPGGEI